MTNIDVCSDSKKQQPTSDYTYDFDQIKAMNPRKKKSATRRYIIIEGIIQEKEKIFKSYA